METKQFFETIYGPLGKGKAVIVLPNYQNKPVNDVWFNYPADIDKMVKLVEQNRTGSVWYSPVLFKSESRTKENALALNVFAADADECDPSNFRLPPSLVVETSVGRWHVYWIIDREDNYEAAPIAAVNRRIAQVHKDQGCDIAFVNSAKLLRVPGTSNHKHPGDVVIVSDYDDVTYDYFDFVKFYPESEVPEQVVAQSVDMPDDLAQYVTDKRADLLQGLPNATGMRDLLFGRYHPDKRSETRYKLLTELVRIGLDDRVVVTVAWGAPSNKYNGDDPRGLKGLWDETIKARIDVANEPEYDGEYVDEPETKKLIPITNFLTDEEIVLVNSQVNFIDEWVSWGQTKTDAPPEYHRAAAVTLLSTVYSEFGHAKPKFAPTGLKLNIWTMVLGRSTLDRKSTARGYMNNALRKLRTEEHDYSLGDDVTPSGISLALHDRANRASVFDRDEVQGLLKELLHQSYMTGGMEVFTKLYDGWSGGRIRASGDRKVQPSVPVSFIMFMMGILTETADVLTLGNYRSGFLTRFVYVIGKRPDDFEPDPIEQGEDGDDQEDKVFNSLVDHLAANRNYWSMLTEEGVTLKIGADPDAWARLQKFESDANGRARQSQYSEVIATTTQRMIITTLKLATLLAMDDRSESVKLIHMLQAISYAGEWFDNSITVASMVSESDWERDVTELEKFLVAKGGRVSYATAYGQFKGKKPKEFDDLVQALEQRGVVNRIQAGSKWVLEIDYRED